MNIINAASHQQTLKTLLDLLGRDVQTQVFFLFDGFFNHIKSTFFVACHVTSNRSLNIPCRSLIN